MRLTFDEFLSSPQILFLAVVFLLDVCYTFLAYSLMLMRNCSMSMAIN